MTIDTLEIARELEAAGLDRKLAEAHAGVLLRAVTGAAASKADLENAVLRLEAKIDGDISRLEAKVDGDISRLEAKIDGDMSRLEAKIDGDMSRLEAKSDRDMSRLEARIDGRLAALEMRLFKYMIGQAAGIVGVLATLMFAAFRLLR